MNQKTFMVGCGALGCELLKNFAMEGSGAGLTALLRSPIMIVLRFQIYQGSFFSGKQCWETEIVGAFEAVELMNKDIKVKALNSLLKNEDRENIQR